VYDTKEQLRTVKYLAAAVDGWSGTVLGRPHIFGFVIHYISSDWILTTRTIGASATPNSTGFTLAEEVSKVAKTHEFKDKLITLMMDCCSTNGRLCALLNAKSLNDLPKAMVRDLGMCPQDL